MEPLKIMDQTDRCLIENQSWILIDVLLDKSNLTILVLICFRRIEAEPKENRNDECSFYRNPFCRSHFVQMMFRRKDVSPNGHYPIFFSSTKQTSTIDQLSTLHDYN